LNHEPTVRDDSSWSDTAPWRTDRASDDSGSTQISSNELIDSRIQSNNDNNGTERGEASDQLAATWSQQQDDQQQHRMQEDINRHQREEDDRLRHEKQQEIQRINDVLQMTLAMRQEEEAAARAKADQFLQDQIRREQEFQQDSRQDKYIVQPNDTLESVVLKKLHDHSLVPLVLSLNKFRIEERTVRGKPSYVLKPGTVLVLPSRKQIREYKERVHSQKSNRSHSLPPTAAEMQARDNRRTNVEKLLGSLNRSAQEPEHVTYKVRLGDSLRSIAMKHPALDDVGLWKLIAQKNNLPITTDSTGTPTVTLKRGSEILLPSNEEIATFKQKIALEFEPTDGMKFGHH
jgi:LysM repeat protein